MHILTLTSLFPNSLQPVHGVFVFNRMDRFVRDHAHAWSIVAPVPWFPKFPFPTSPAYDTFARVPREEAFLGRTVAHPRYLVTPKFGMRHYGTWMAAGALRQVERIHARHPIDAIDGHYIYPDGHAAIAIGRKLGIPVVLSARGTDLNLFPRLPDIAPLIRADLEASDAVICVSPDLGDIAERNGAARAKIRVIGNGVDTRRFRPADKAESRAGLGLPAQGTLLLSVGHLVALKGFDLAMHAVARQDRKDLTLALVGEGPERGRLERLAGELGIRDRVRFAGAVGNADLAPWYAAADLFFLGSSREGWPNVICEAQAMGLPVVGNGLPILRDLVPEGMGRLADERTPEGLSAALAAALATAFDREAILGLGQSRSWEKAGAELQSVFTSLPARARR